MQKAPVMDPPTLEGSKASVDYLDLKPSMNFQEPEIS